MSRNASTSVEDGTESPDGDTEIGNKPSPQPKAPSTRRAREAAVKKRKLGDYRIVALLGVGGMAQVHLAMKHGPGGFTKLLVVKSMLEELDDPIYERSFMHEARLAAQLNHPNVVQTYEVGTDSGKPFIAMEYVEGQTMRAVQRRMAPARLPLPVQLRIIEETARGLHHAHTLKNFNGTPMGIVHRDVSPQNIMLSYDGQVKLLDFGIAKASGSDELTREGMIKGKIDYMAPEQLRGEGIDHRADVFALGVMLWEAVTGKRFSGGAEVAEVTKMHNRLMGKEPRLRDVAPDTPMRLVEICEKAIAVNSSDRQATAEDLAQAIGDYLRETSKTTDSRDLAKVLETLFAAERKNMRDLIEEQLRVMNSPDAEEEDILVPVISQTDGNTATPLSHSNEFPRALRKQVEAEAPEPQAPSATPKIIVGLAVFVAVLGGLVVMQRPQGTETPAIPQAPAAPAPAAATATVMLHIDGTPDSVTALLDGSSIELPFDAQLASDGRLHRVVLQAPGYVSAERTFTLTHDTRINLDLERASEPAAAVEEETTENGRNAAGARRVRRAGDGPETATVAAPPAQTVAQPPPQQTATPTATGTTPASGRRRPSVDSDNPYEQ